MSGWSDDLLACVRWAVFDDHLPDLAALPEDRWQRLLADARLQRLPAVVAAVEGIAGTLHDERRTALEALEREWCLHSLQAEHATLRMVNDLEAEGIEVRVLKGTMLAHGFWPAPHLRVFGDADLLVRSVQLDDAVAAVRSAGGFRPLPEVRRGFDRRFGKSVTMRHPSGVEIDLHRTLVAGPHTFIIPEEHLWGPGEQVEVAGQLLHGMSAPAQAVHAAAHAVASRSPRLASLLDVAFTAERADLDEASRLAERWRLRAVVTEAGRRLAEALGRPHPATAWAAAQRGSTEEERLLDVLRDGTYRASARASLGYIPRAADRVRFLAGLAWPSPAHRRAR